MLPSRPPTCLVSVDWHAGRTMTSATTINRLIPLWIPPLYPLKVPPKFYFSRTMQERSPSRNPSSPGLPLLFPRSTRALHLPAQGGRTFASGELLLEQIYGLKSIFYPGKTNSSKDEKNSSARNIPRVDSDALGLLVSGSRRSGSVWRIQDEREGLYRPEPHCEGRKLLATSQIGLSWHSLK